MFFKKYIYILLIFLFNSSAYQLTFNELIPYTDSINDLIQQKFIQTIKAEKKKSLQIEKKLDETIISYQDRKFGYDYNATYNIIKKKKDDFEIIYKNNFLDNSIYLQRFDSNIMNVTVKIQTYIPIPKKLLTSIIQKKLNFLKS